MFSKQGGKPRKVQDPGEALNPETPGPVHVSFSFFVACGQRWETQQWVRLPVTAAGWLTLTTRLFCQAVVLDLYVMCFPCDCLQLFSLNFGFQQFGSDVFRGFCLSWISGLCSLIDFGKFLPVISSRILLPLSLFLGLQLHVCYFIPQLLFTFFLFVFVWFLLTYFQVYWFFCSFQAASKLI